MEKKLFRVIDANANRAREGLRVVEEISRLVLEDAKLTSEWKNARHRISDLLAELPAGGSLIQERDSDNDIGKTLHAEGEQKRADYCELAMINARRAEEGIRVLEEFTKLISPELGRQFKELRFHIYSLEKKTTLLTKGG